MYLKNSFILILFFILSCQPVEILKPIEIDTSKFEIISINAAQIEVNKKYNSVFSKSNIEDQIQKSPIKLIGVFCIWSSILDLENTELYFLLISICCAFIDIFSNEDVSISIGFNISIGWQDRIINKIKIKLFLKYIN